MDRCGSASPVRCSRGTRNDRNLVACAIVAEVDTRGATSVEVAGLAAVAHDALTIVPVVSVPVPLLPECFGLAGLDARTVGGRGPLDTW